MKANNAPKTGQRLMIQQKGLVMAPAYASLGAQPASGAWQTTRQQQGRCAGLAQPSRVSSDAEHRRIRLCRPLIRIRDEARNLRRTGPLSKAVPKEAADWPAANIRVVDVAGLRTYSSPANNQPDPDYDLLSGTLRAAVEAARVGAEEEGFFQVVGHGVSEALLQRVVKAQRWFFSLPPEAKESVRRSESNSRGWYNDGLTKQRVDWKESFDFGVEGAADEIDGSNRWPSEPPEEAAEFRAAMVEYFEEMTALSRFLAGLLATSLGLPSTHFDEDFLEHTSYIGLNFYPRCSDPSQHLGVNPHKDAGLLTVLAQHDIGGLQVYVGCGDGLDSSDSKWTRIDPLPGALLVNVGDLLQVASNGAFRAPLHRVLSNLTSERMSAPFFFNPAHCAVIGPAEGLAGAAAATPAYCPVPWGEFRRRRLEGDMKDLGREVQVEDFLL